MSRRSKPTPNENDSHPQEHYEVYRTFLMRSLDRCDTEIAALVQLNHSLHAVKSGIIETCGEATLLDIGEGLLKLGNDEDVLEGKIPKKGQDFCVDFLLRMKLRRKLLNRLSRRLNRLAHAMDGEDVQPPHPPKYGDLSLHIDPRAVRGFEQRWKRQEAAMKRIQMRNESCIPVTTEQEDMEEDGKVEQSPPSHIKVEEKAGEDQDDEMEEVPGDAKVNEKTGEDQMNGAEEAKEEGTAEPKSTEKGADEAKTADQSKVSEKAEEVKSSRSSEEKVEEKAQPESVTSSPGKPPTDETVMPEAPTTSPDDQTDLELSKVVDYEILRDYDDAYTKKIMPSRGTVSYPILDKKGQEDHSFIKYGAGIGATHRTLSSKDKDAEFKRWQTAVLGRIPDQPTFEELGLANRVFFLEERRKRLAGEDITSPSKKNKSKKVEAKVDSDKNSDDDVEMMTEADDAEEDKGDDDGEDTVMDDAQSKSEEEGKAKAAPIKPVKPISLVAVPSYHEQDQKRVRLIHMDLMGASMHDYARRRVAEVTQEYNEAFRKSSHLYTYRCKLQTELNQISYDNRAKLAQLTNEYTVDVAVNRTRWEKRYREHALGQLPSAYGQVALGTPLTKTAASSPDPVTSNVGKALADIVDCVIMRGERGWRDEDRIQEFNPPPRPDFTEYIDEESGETLGQTQERREGDVRRKLAELATKLHVSEEERRKAWKKLLKTKADFDMSHTTNAGGRGGTVAFGPNQLHLLPVPPLHGSVTAVLPPMHNYPPPSVASYVPPPMASLPISRVANTSESKYSIAKVRERIAPDGSVMPASEPKKNKDGIYVRPPGRGRIGMDWDEVRGLWVPARP